MHKVPKLPLWVRQTLFIVGVFVMSLLVFMIPEHMVGVGICATKLLSVVLLVIGFAFIIKAAGGR